MNGPRKKLGATRAVSTRAVAASGAPLMFAASAVTANRPTQSPNALMTCAIQSQEYSTEPNSRIRTGAWTAVDVTRFDPPSEGLVGRRCDERVGDGLGGDGGGRRLLGSA